MPMTTNHPTHDERHGRIHDGATSPLDVPGHRAHSGHMGHMDHAAMFRGKFWLSLVLAVPVVVFSGGFQHLLGYHWAFTGSFLIAPIVGTAVYLYGGWPFLSGAASEIRSRKPGMMLLIAMAITVAFAASLANAFGIFGVEVWWELALLIVIMLLGHWVEMRAVGKASGALDALAALLPDEAEIVEGDTTRTVPASELAIGDVMLVRSGSRIPADGTVIDGEADIDESAITGESRPVHRGVGANVVAGTVATDSAIRVRIDAVGDDTALAGIGRLVAQAQSSQSRAQTLADRAAALLFYAALGAAAVTAATWSLMGQPDQALVLVVTVLIIACPHALGLAVPLVTAISTALSARHGILVKDRLTLERMRTVDIVMFDKTGTLTLGQHRVTGTWAASGNDEAMANGVLLKAAAVEADSEHPLARAIVTAAREIGDPSQASGFRSVTGRGVHAVIDGIDTAVGGPAMLREVGVDPPAALTEQLGTWRSRGATVLYVLENGFEDWTVTGALALEDEIRPESRQALAALHATGVRVGMITGDAQQVADAVAADLGIDEVFAEVLPADKDCAIIELQQRGHTVAMVGDGVNDAPALARADVGVAIGAGTDVAVESAGIVLATSDPRAVITVRKLSARTYRKMLQNLWWAGGYNIIAIPLAAGVLAWAGFVMPMAVGAILMSLSTVIVALNAQLVRRVNLTAA